MSAFINLSVYKFTPLDRLPELKARLLMLTTAAGLKGTILLSPEGINLFVAGTRESTDALMAALHAVPGLEDLTPKESFSAKQPYSRMLVKIKKEIIAFGVPGIDPASRPAPKLSPHKLKQWLDEGRPLTLIDTRNDYEVRMGTFKGAIPASIENFRDFPTAVSKLPAELKEQPIVMFCTGGIRCEKAGPYMQQAGFKDVHQLDGGILKYFEECGGAHYDGECFVFDYRVGVDPSLQETKSALCFTCQMPLKEVEQTDPRYVPGKTCPHCYEQVTAANSLLAAQL
ncbi:MAG: sulfurtransferase [Cephaloticoccus sp.]|nr:sulfurtransferase [Cephaloticoccus sp.]MCF7761131.1 sulfurtransferase [Cephaloticoccus sp.]